MVVINRIIKSMKTLLETEMDFWKCSTGKYSKKKNWKNKKLLGWITLTIMDDIRTKHN